MSRMLKLWSRCHTICTEIMDAYRNPFWSKKQKTWYSHNYYRLITSQEANLTLLHYCSPVNPFTNNQWKWWIPAQNSGMIKRMSMGARFPVSLHPWQVKSGNNTLMFGNQQTKKHQNSKKFYEVFNIPSELIVQIDDGGVVLNHCNLHWKRKWNGYVHDKVREIKQGIWVLWK